MSALPKAKVSLSNPTSSREVTLRDTLPPNIIPFHEYLAQWKLKQSLNSFSHRTARARWENAAISALYSRFFRPFFPGRFTLDHYHLFLSLTLPSLTRFMSFDSIQCLCAAVHWRYRKMLNSARITHGKHKKRCMAIIYNTHIPRAPDHPCLKTPLHREAWRVIWALATHKGDGSACEGHFYLAGREFQIRLFVKSYKTAQRLLERFCKAGLLVQTSAGQTRWEALRLGKRAMANTYRLNLPAERA